MEKEKGGKNTPPLLVCYILIFGLLMKWVTEDFNTMSQDISNFKHSPYTSRFY